MIEIREDLKPHPDREAESQLKSLIKEIETLLNEPAEDSTVGEKLKEASRYVKAPDRVLDQSVIENYDSWTDLDGLAGELTMEVPRLTDISKEDFKSLVGWIREVIETQETGGIRFDYWMNFYTTFFELNFPDVEEVDLFDEICEGTPLEELVGIAF